MPRAAAMLLCLLLAAPAWASQISEPRMLGAGLPSAADLRALRLSGSPCAASVYRTAWSTARAYAMEPAWVIAIIEAESSCRPDARSPAGARGLMQLMPDAGARSAYQLAFGRDERPGDVLLRDPQINIRLGVIYLAQLQRHFERIASPQARLLLAVASYNCGTDVFDSGLPLDAAVWDEAQTRHWIAAHAPRQTRDYVLQVQAAALRHLDALLSLREPEQSLQLASAAGAP